MQPIRTFSFACLSEINILNARETGEKLLNFLFFVA